MTDQIDHISSGGGNTVTPPVKQGNLSNYWFFTLNNHKESQIDRLDQIFRHECRWFVFQEEIGESGTPHLQGSCCFRDRKRLTALKQIDPTIHWEVTKSINASLEYCTKYESCTGRQWIYNIKTPPRIELEEPYGWQLNVLNIIKQKPDKRTIHWFWEKTGGVGKTSLAKYLVVKHDAIVVTGKSNDMFHAIAKKKHPIIVVVDVPRSTQDYVNYGAIEMIKNGLIFSGKFDSCQLVFNSPHVIVFANEKPDISKMSSDRWNIIEIDGVDL